MREPPTKAYDLRNHVAVVTGAARMRGIGRAIARRLAADGAAVCLVGHPNSPPAKSEAEERAQWQGIDSIVAEIDNAGGQAFACRADVADSEHVQRVIADVLGHFGHVDIVVNNAAINPQWLAEGVPFVDLELATWDKVMSVNVRSAFLFAKFAVPHMIERRYGHIINISSRAGKVGIPGVAAYCASKFALIGLTQSLALELAPFGIQVNAVCPGWINTDLNVRWGAPEAKAWGVPIEVAQTRLARAAPLGRVGEPAEVANIVSFLVSGQASYMTGQAINVTGGRLMQ